MTTNTFFAFLENFSRTTWKASAYHKLRTPALSVLPKDTTSKLAGLFSTLSLFAERQARKLWIPFFTVFWFDSNWEMNPGSTDCEADVLTTTPSRRLMMLVIFSNLWLER